VKTFRSILLYAVSLALLTVGLRVLEYKLLIVNHAQELYIGAIALLFTGVGIWAGGALRNRVRHTPLIGPESLTAFDPNPDALRRTGITARELEVLQLVALGLSTREIADKLFISISTVKTHTASIFQKLDARRRTQAVQKAKATGLLP
jgi:DNA-binding CsgD family transcriptional regulator